MHSGDGGWMNDQGYVFIADRLKDMIVSGGENVYSAEVENVLIRHPGVAQCAVIGLPDDDWGERVHAVVVRVPGAEVDPVELASFAVSRSLPTRARARSRSSMSCPSLGRERS